MDIAALSMSMSQSSVKGQVGIALMKITMNSNETMASQMTEMMKSASVDPNLGKVIDVTV